jgi:hypothetical protein
MKKDILIYFLATFIIGIVLIGAITFVSELSKVRNICEMWRYSPAYEIPVNCLDYYGLK